MAEQDRSHQIEEAISILKKHGTQRRDGGFHPNVLRIRALGPKGQCGACVNLNLSIIKRNEVEIDCFAGKSPLSLQINTPLGEKANCDKFKQLKK